MRNNPFERINIKAIENNLAEQRPGWVQNAAQIRTAVYDMILNPSRKNTEMLLTLMQLSPNNSASFYLKLKKMIPNLPKVIQDILNNNPQLRQKLQQQNPQLDLNNLNNNLNSELTIMFLIQNGYISFLQSFTDQADIEQNENDSNYTSQHDELTPDPKPKLSEVSPQEALIEKIEKSKSGERFSENASSQNEKCDHPFASLLHAILDHTFGKVEASAVATEAATHTMKLGTTAG